MQTRNKSYYTFFTVFLLGFLFFGLKEFAEKIYHPLQSIVASIGVLLIFGSPFYFKIRMFNPLTGNIKIIFNLYLCYIFFIIVRPFFSVQEYTNNSIHPYEIYGLTSYLLPLIVLFGTEIISPKKLFKIVFVFSIIGFVFFVLNFKEMQSVVIRGITATLNGKVGLGDLANKYYYWFSISCFSLLCYEFMTLKKRIFAIFSSFFLLFLMAYFARRSGVGMIALYFFGILYLYFEALKKKDRILKLFFVGLLILALYILIINNLNSTFSLLIKRLDEDTRNGVDVALIKHLSNQDAWIFGQGIEGAYKMPRFHGLRYVHETGYLYLILKGGIVYLTFYVYLLLHASYIGFFKTRNRLTKALALYVFFHVVFLIPFGVPSFGLEYLFVWIAFAFCESRYWRSMTNDQIKNKLETY